MVGNDHFLHFDGNAKEGGFVMGWIKIVFTTVVLAVLFLSGCRRYSVPPVIIAEADPLTAETPVVEKPVEIFLPACDSNETIYTGLYENASVEAFYKLTKNRAVWVHHDRNSALADSMVQLIRNIRLYGLLPQNYHEEELMSDSNSRSSPESLLRRDVLLTDAFLSIAKDLKRGRLRQPQPMDDSLQRLLLMTVLHNGGLKSHLESQEPEIAAYKLLKYGLVRLFDTLGATDRALLLRGTTIDSIPVHQKVQSIEINMERWRWESNKLRNRFIFINIPSFMAQVFDRDSVILESRVIIGTRDHPTPQLSSTIQCLITYPYWHVPRKIAVDELLPMVQKDPDYVARNNFDVLDRRGRILDPDTVDWKAFNRNNFPFSLRQREGVDNSLGILKFVFDNPYAVYLHDTNARRLFQNKMRAFSHGCIRMEKSVEFAHYLVTGNVHERSAMLEKFLKQKQRQNVDLSYPIDIHVRYITAEVRGEEIHLHHDLYGNDQALIDSLYHRQSRHYY
jgi:L,D-transpeptidase YcbB